MRIGVDIDGVLADFCTSYEKLFIEVTGRNTFTPWEYPHGPISWDWPSDHGYTKAETSEVWRQIKESNGFWMHLNPHLDAVKDLQRYYQPLRSRGHEWYFVTNRPGQTAKHQTERWLSRWFITPQVIIAKTGEKGIISSTLGIERFIDDNPDNCKDVVTQSASKVYLVRRRYNAHAHEDLMDKGVVTIPDMRTFLDTFADDLMADSRI